MTTYVYNEHDENQVLTMRNKLKKKKRKRRINFVLIVLLLIFLVIFFFGNMSKVKKITVSGCHLTSAEEIIERLPGVPADCCCTAPVPSTLRRTKGYCATSRPGRPARPNLPNGSRSIRRGASCAARRAISRPSASIPTGWRARAFSRRRCANVPPAASGGECPDRSATRWRGPTAVPCRSWSGGWRSPKRCGSLPWAIRSTAIGSRRRRPWRCFRVC